MKRIPKAMILFALLFLMINESGIKVINRIKGGETT